MDMLKFITFNAIESGGNVTGNVVQCSMPCDVINNYSVIEQCKQSTVPDSPFRIEFPSTWFLVELSCPRYEKHFVSAH